MKVKTFEKFIRTVIREEIDSALRREISFLKEELIGNTKPIMQENTNIEEFRSKLREQVAPPPNFNTGDDTLNSLLQETATTPSWEDKIAANDPVNQFINKDYRPVMDAIGKKKDFRP
jgi:hypothetical protein